MVDSNDTRSEHEKRSDFWMKVAGVTFGLWSLAVPFGVVLIRDSVREVVASQDKFQSQFNNYVLVMERRLTLVEERQGTVLRRLDIIETLINRQEGLNGSQSKSR